MELMSEGSSYLEVQHHPVRAVPRSDASAGIRLPQFIRLSDLVKAALLTNHGQPTQITNGKTSRFARKNRRREIRFAGRDTEASLAI